MWRVATKLCGKPVFQYILTNDMGITHGNAL